MKAYARAALLVCVIAGCARVEAPPGGDIPPVPPGIIATVPEHGATIEPTRDPVVFRFEHPLSERNISDAIAMVSPATGRVHVDRSGHELRVSIEDGWQAGHEYRVVLLPGITSRYNVPARRTPAELIFSTGPPLVPTAIAGLVVDRITGRPVQSQAQAQVLVQARARGDTLAYRTVADTGGFFALRHLPPQTTYDVTAYIDMNQNRQRDSTETYAPSRAITINRETDTIPDVFMLVPADPTPPAVTGATFRDSLQVRITTDDYLDPQADLELVDVELLQLPDSVPLGARLMSTHAFQRMRAAADTAGAPPRAAQDTTIPVREFVLVPDAPLATATYIATIGGLVNISGLYGGGGTATFEVPERSPPARLRPRHR